MVYTLLSLSYHLWVLALIAASIAGIGLLTLEILNTYHHYATHAKAQSNYAAWQKVWGITREHGHTLVVYLFRIAMVAAILSYGSAILHLLIGGGINAL